MVKKASKEYAQALGNVILRERNRRGWSATELGRRVGVSRACVSSWELAISSPTWFNLVNLAAIMRLPLSNLMRRVELEMDKDNDVGEESDGKGITAVDAIQRTGNAPVG